MKSAGNMQRTVSFLNKHLRPITQWGKGDRAHGKKLNSKPCFAAPYNRLQSSGSAWFQVKTPEARGRVRELPVAGLLYCTVAISIWVRQAKNPPIPQSFLARFYGRKR